MQELQGLQWHSQPSLQQGTMLLAFSGWMDGGDVSTGTVRRLIEQLQAPRFASIDPEGYFIYNFPGAMEVAALFRPEVRIEDGRVRQFTEPANDFHVDLQHRLVLFLGKEPNLHWRTFARCILAVAAGTGVSRIVFVGSFGGTVPHTRQPRLYATISHDSLQPLYERYNLRPSTYAGPGSFASYLMTQVGQHGLEMISLAAEIPGYLQGTNPASIEAVTRRLGALLNVEVNLPQLRSDSDDWESRVTEAVQKDAELTERIAQLEQAYDDDLLDDSGKTWFGERKEDE